MGKRNFYDGRAFTRASATDDIVDFSFLIIMLADNCVCLQTGSVALQQLMSAEEQCSTELWK